jgi:hypothetical protein
VNARDLFGPEEITVSISSRLFLIQARFGGVMVIEAVYFNTLFNCICTETGEPYYVNGNELVIPVTKKQGKKK